ncbi:MAG TPA: NlpC/P60 family protein [Desulfosporosinus sp.]|nr:NlpC/P60 family protein [Desulfosporosinus sp.]
MKRIRFFYKTSLVTIIGVTLLVASALPVRANLQDQLNQNQQQADQLNGVLNAQKDKVAEATTQVVSLKQSVLALNNSMAREQVILTQEQNNLTALEAKQKELEVQRQEHIVALGSVLKSNYEDGATNYLQMLFKATSVPDFIERADKIKMVIGTYSKLQKDIVELDETMNGQKELIVQKQTTIQASIDGKVQTQQAMQLTLDKQQTVLALLSADERSMLNSSVSASAKVSRVEQLMQQEAFEARERANPTVSRSTSDSASESPVVQGNVTVSGGAQHLLSYGARFLGVRYLWGGQTPSGFDCSGFTGYVFKHAAGITLSRTSQQQIYNGARVGRSELRPGDLVFFHTNSSSPSSISHVGIYVGNNMMINSSNGGVSYDNMSDSYWGKRFAGACRVIAS